MTANTTVPLAAEPKTGPNEVVNGGHGPKTERSAADVEQQVPPTGSQKSTFSSLGLLDRYLAVWIFLAMLTGILLGNFVPSVGPALQKGKFVGVSVPIGKNIEALGQEFFTNRASHWAARHDVSHIVQSPVREAAHYLPHPRDLGPAGFQHCRQLDCGALLHGKTTRPNLLCSWLTN